MNNQTAHLLKTLPLIKENLFLKAYCAHRYLKKRFASFDPAVFDKAWSRLALENYPKAEVSISDKIKVPAVIPERERRILGRRIFPVIYGLTANKVRDAGAKRLMRGFLQQAIDDPEYHGLRLSLLSSFYEFWGEVEGVSDLEALWVDRFAEFCAMNFYSEKSDFSLKKYESKGNTNLSAVILEVAKKPGYEGNHLVFLASIEELKTELLKDQREEIIYKAQVMANLIYSDAEDNVVINLPSNQPATTETLETQIKTLITQGPDDPQTLIVARAICHLWDIADDEAKTWLISCAERFMRRA